MQTIVIILIVAAFGFVGYKLLKKAPKAPVSNSPKKGGVSAPAEDPGQYYKGTRKAK